jgi:hypothetical protein
MADIKFACPGCKATLKVSDTLVGKKIKCPKCAAIAPIPAAGAPAAPPAAAPAKPAALAKPAAVVKPAAPAAKPAAPAAKPAAPPLPPPAPKKPASPIKPPPAVMEAPQAPDIPDYGPDDMDEEMNEVPAPRALRKAAPAPKQGGLDVFGILIGLVALGYLTFAGLVYFGIVWPKPAEIKATEKKAELNDRNPGNKFPEPLGMPQPAELAATDLKSQESGNGAVSVPEPPTIAMPNP